MACPNQQSLSHAAEEHNFSSTLQHHCRTWVDVEATFGYHCVKCASQRWTENPELSLALERWALHSHWFPCTTCALLTTPFMHISRNCTVWYVFESPVLCWCREQCSVWHRSGPRGLHGRRGEISLYIIQHKLLFVCSNRVFIFYIGKCPQANPIEISLKAIRQIYQLKVNLTKRNQWHEWEDSDVDCTSIDRTFSYV